ncbi:MAG: FAD-dependent oxidoreductase [Deltaproteobacteria bacterium]|nr:FAD-dependent oxidoreductase [Deltaproteobacteria bacterium]MCB9787482.1 FAD-dependent oxidoreductase [Deltaproteobacteria bacterium]
MGPLRRFAQAPERHEPLPGKARLLEPLRVTVVGGGLAGCAAALILAERGAAVTVIEREPVLGGRVGAIPDRLATGQPIAMERGFHAFFRQYYNLRAFMRRFDPDLSSLVPLDDYPLLGPGGRSESFAGLPHATPLNVMALVWRTPSLGLGDLARVDARQALEMLRFSPERTWAAFDDQPASTWLDALRFPARARQMLFDVFAHSFFDAEHEMSAARMIEMFHLYFTGNPEGLVFDVMGSPFSEGLWRPAQALLEGLGVRFVPDTRVEGLDRAGSALRVRTSGSDELADAVVLATDVAGLQTIVAGSPQVAPAALRAQVARLSAARPFCVWRLWLDAPTRPGRSAFAGTAGCGWLDNISLLHLYQDEARAFAEGSGGSVVELHAYALPPGTDEGAVRRDLWRQAVALYPELGAARVIDERLLLRDDCPAFPPGSRAQRPTVATAEPRLVLAGDHVRLPFPAALMEAAVSSGMLAANHLLATAGVRGETLWSVPRRGIFASGGPR